MPLENSSNYGDIWASVYDTEHAEMHPSDAQLEMLAELAGNGRALELGVGTGRVALPLAARGVNVEGIDTSTAMIEQLQAKPGGDRIAVSVGDMAALDVGGDFRLVYVLFNSLFLLTTQADQVRCFETVAHVLEPGGVFVTECFFPDLGRFDRGQSLRVTQVNDSVVKLDASRHDAVNQVVTSSQIRIGNEGISLLPVTIRYSWPTELDLMAQLSGLRLRERWDGWNRQPYTASSATVVSVYESRHAGGSGTT